MNSPPIAIPETSSIWLEIGKLQTSDANQDAQIKEVRADLHQLKESSATMGDKLDVIATAVADLPDMKAYIVEDREEKKQVKATQDRHTKAIQLALGRIGVGIIALLGLVMASIVPNIGKLPARDLIIIAGIVVALYGLRIVFEFIQVRKTP